MLSLCLITLLILPQLRAFQPSIYSDSIDDECKLDNEEFVDEWPKTAGPLVPCNTLTHEWFECEDVTQLVLDNSTKVGFQAL